MAIRTPVTRRSLLLSAAAPLLAQQSAEPPEKPVEFICPMDPEVRSIVPGTCPRCSMKLVPGLPDPREFLMNLRHASRPVRAGIPTELIFTAVDPKDGKLVRDFEVIHEKLFHLFIVSQDLKVFAHEHPVKEFGPEFHLEWTFPLPGMYRLMCDYFPMGATPQLTVKTLFVTDGPGSPVTAPESNTEVSFSTEPANPLSGMRTQLHFQLNPSEGLIPWLGAWGHILVASDDLVDLIHTHPFIADGGKQMQFNVIFPRPVKYRIWVQFERQQLVNTVTFPVDVQAL